MKSRNLLSLTASITLAGAMLCPVHAAGYLKLGDIKGESTDEAHKDWINLLSVSSSITRPTGAGGPTRQALATVRAPVAGKHIPQGVLIMRKAGGDASRQLQTASRQKRTFPDATIHFVNDDTGEIYLKITMTDLLVSSYQTGDSAAGDSAPMDQLSINFSKITYEYEPAKAGGNAKTTWKVEEGEI